MRTADNCHHNLNRKPAMLIPMPKPKLTSKLIQTLMLNRMMTVRFLLLRTLLVQRSLHNLWLLPHSHH